MNKAILTALQDLLKVCESQLDQSATDQGLTNCAALANARAALRTIPETTTFKIYQGDVLQKVFENQESDFPALKWIQSHQGQSLNWALKNGGWKVEMIDDQTGKIELMKP